MATENKKLSIYEGTTEKYFVVRKNPDTDEEETAYWDTFSYQVRWIKALDESSTDFKTNGKAEEFAKMQKQMQGFFGSKFNFAVLKQTITVTSDGGYKETTEIA